MDKIITSLARAAHWRGLRPRDLQTKRDIFALSGQALRTVAVAAAGLCVINRLGTDTDGTFRR